MDKFWIRSAVPNDAQRMAEILVTAQRAVFSGLVPEKCLDFPVEESRRNWRETLIENESSQEFLLLVAENEDGLVIGYGMWSEGSRHPDFASELRVLMVDPAWQRQGIGRLLVQRGATFYQKQDMGTMLVGVLKINPNTVFYEQLGAELVEERPYTWEGFQTIEWLYGWNNLERLINRRGR